MAILGFALKVSPSQAPATCGRAQAATCALRTRGCGRGRLGSKQRHGEDPVTTLGQRASPHGIGWTSRPQRSLPVGGPERLRGVPPRAWRGAARGQTSEQRHGQHAAMRASPSSSYRLTPSTRSGAAACTPTMLPRLGSGMRSHSRACHRTRIVASEGSERWYERSASATAVLRVRRSASKSCRYARIPRKRPSGTPECKNWTARGVRHESMSGLCLTWATVVQQWFNWQRQTVVRVNLEVGEIREEVGV